MCDILAISAGFNYTPKQYLPLFAERGRRNMNGWAIGFFREGQAVVEARDLLIYTLMRRRKHPKNVYS